MSIVFARSRRFLGVTIAALTFGTTGCDDGHDHEHLEVEFMRLTIGAQTITVNARGEISGGTVTIPAGVATTVTAVFLDDDMQPDDHVEADEFQLSVTPNAGITFTRTGAFSGTLLGTTAGSIVVRFGLLHVEEDHHDFGPFQVPVTVGGA